MHSTISFATLFATNSAQSFIHSFQFHCYITIFVVCQTLAARCQCVFIDVLALVVVSIVVVVAVVVVAVAAIAFAVVAVAVVAVEP